MVKVNGSTVLDDQMKSKSAYILCILEEIKGGPAIWFNNNST